MSSSPWEFWRYAEGFKIVADNAVQNLCPSKNNLVGFPIGYLYGHSLELMIKGLTLQARLVLNEQSSYEENHRLEELWKECRSLVEKVTPQSREQQFESVEECARAFGPILQFLRYPEGRNRRNWQPPFEYLNVAKMRNAFSDAAETLNSLYDQMHHILEYRALATP